jgi:hypothetical protein
VPESSAAVVRKKSEIHPVRHHHQSRYNILYSQHAERRERLCAAPPSKVEPKSFLCLSILKFSLDMLSLELIILILQENIFYSPGFNFEK